ARQPPGPSGADGPLRGGCAWPDATPTGTGGRSPPPATATSPSTSEPDHLGWKQLTQRGRSVRCRGWTAVHKIQAEPTGLLGAPFDIGRLPANNCAPTRLMRANWRLA